MPKCLIYCTKNKYVLCGMHPVFLKLPRSSRGTKHVLCKHISMQGILETQGPYIKQIFLFKSYVKYSGCIHLPRKYSDI